MDRHQFTVEADPAVLNAAALLGISPENIMALALEGLRARQIHPPLRTDIAADAARAEQWSARFMHRFTEHEMATDLRGASLELRAAIEAAKVAGVVASTHLGMGVTFDAKGGSSDLVSAADKVADSVSRVGIARRLRGLVHVAEESAPDARPMEGERFGTFDGLDGSFAAAYAMHGQYAVMIAIGEMKNAVVEHLAAALAFPVTGDLVCADRGRGAWHNGKKIEGKPQATLKNGSVAFNMQRLTIDRNTEVVDLHSAMHTNEHGLSLPRIVTSGLPTSLDALQIFDPQNPLVALVHDNSAIKVKQGPWDIMPIFALAREVSGAVFRNFDGGEVNPFVPEPMIIAANQMVYDEIIALLEWTRGNKAK